MNNDSRFCGLKYVVIAIVVFTVLSATTHVSYAQKNVRGGLNFMIGIPKGEFSENVENIGLGGSLFAGYHLPNSPLTIGANIGFLIYGRDARRERFSLTIPDAMVVVTNSNNIVLTHLLLRLQPESGKVLPYFDSLIGFNYLFTDTSIRGERDYEEIATSTNFSDFAFSYGLGGGIKIKVYEPRNSDAFKKGPRAVFIDFCARYLLGTEAEYLKKGSIQRVNGEAYYDVSKSKTDILLINIGVSVGF